MKKAEYHFEQALISDMNYVATYEQYSLLLIYLKEHAKALKLIKHACRLKGVDLSAMQHRKALIFEAKRNYVSAKKIMKLAYSNAFNEQARTFLKNENELERVKSKLNDGKKKRRKKKKSSK